MGLANALYRRRLYMALVFSFPVWLIGEGRTTWLLMQLRIILIYSHTVGNMAQ